MEDHPMPKDIADRGPMVEGEEFGFALSYGRIPYLVSENDTLMATIEIDPVELKQFLIADAHASLAPGTRFALHERFAEAGSKRYGMAWVTGPWVEMHPAWNGYVAGEKQSGE